MKLPLQPDYPFHHGYSKISTWTTTVVKLPLQWNYYCSKTTTSVKLPVHCSQTTATVKLVLELLPQSNYHLNYRVSFLNTMKKKNWLRPKTSVHYQIRGDFTNFSWSFPPLPAAALAASSSIKFSAASTEALCDSGLGLWRLSDSMKQLWSRVETKERHWSDNSETM